MVCEHEYIYEYQPPPPNYRACYGTDSNVFYSSTSIDDVEKVMNEEINNIFQYCDANIKIVS
jgi:hypothetical protein